MEPVNPSLASADLRTRAAERVSWSPQASCSEAGSTFDLLRGRLDELPVGAGSSETCLESGTPALVSTDPTLPAAGQGFYYLVRGINVCGAATYGFRTDGMERVSAACP